MGAVAPPWCRYASASCWRSHSFHSLPVSATIIAGIDDGKEISPLNQTFSIALRMAIVLAFLLGMPLFAVPQFAEQMQTLVTAKPPGQVAQPRPSAPPTYQAARAGVATEQGTTVTMLASSRSPAPFARPNPDGLAATIEALKAEFVEAGVSYMVLERIGSEATQYRFRFDVPVAAGSVYRKRFQVVHDAPDEAMRQAFAELQRWRVASREPAQLARPKVILR